MCARLAGHALPLYFSSSGSGCMPRIPMSTCSLAMTYCPTCTFCRSDVGMNTELHRQWRLDTSPWQPWCTPIPLRESSYTPELLIALSIANCHRVDELRGDRKGPARRVQVRLWPEHSDDGGSTKYLLLDLVSVVIQRYPREAAANL